MRAKQMQVRRACGWSRGDLVTRTQPHSLHQTSTQGDQYQEPASNRFNRTLVRWTRIHVYTMLCSQVSYGRLVHTYIVDDRVDHGKRPATTRWAGIPPRYGTYILCSTLTCPLKSINQRKQCFVRVSRFAEHCKDVKLRTWFLP